MLNWVHMEPSPRSPGSAGGVRKTYKIKEKIKKFLLFFLATLELWNCILRSWSRNANHYTSRRCPLLPSKKIKSWIFLAGIRRTMANENQTYSFEYLFEAGSIKTVVVIYSGIVSIIDALLLFSIIWYEHFGSDNKRTLQVFIFLTQKRFWHVQYFVNRTQRFISKPGLNRQLNSWNWATES